MHRDGSHFLPRSSASFTLVQGSSRTVLGARRRRSPSSVVAVVATMSEKKAAEKVSEIDAHISKQYDIVKRLGKGVKLRFFPPASLFPLFLSPFPRTPPGKFADECGREFLSFSIDKNLRLYIKYTHIAEIILHFICAHCGALFFLNVEIAEETYVVVKCRYFRRKYPFFFFFFFNWKQHVI